MVGKGEGNVAAVCIDTHSSTDDNVMRQTEKAGGEVTGVLQ